MNGTSLFSGGGIGEIFFNNLGINITIANEIEKKRADFYSNLYPNTKILTGSIQDNKIKDEIIKKSKHNKFLISTPPCQGFSTIVATTKVNDFEKDPRNFLIYDTFDIIDNCDFDFIMIENVPRFLKMLHPFNDSFLTIEEIILKKYSQKYSISFNIYDAKDFNVPQFRKRAVIKLWKKKYSWIEPKKYPEVTLSQAIGHLPSIEAGEDSGIEYHVAKSHNEREILAMKHTPTGMSAFKNKNYYPKKINGEKVSGFHNTYKRLEWSKPCKARTTNNGNIGSHNNVHPGRKLDDDIYSDARVLTLLELFLVSSLPNDWQPPAGYGDNLIRQIIGEGIPPKMSYEIIKPIFNKIK